MLPSRAASCHCGPATASRVWRAVPVSVALHTARQGGHWVLSDALQLCFAQRLQGPGSVGAEAQAVVSGLRGRRGWALGSRASRLSRAAMTSRGRPTDHPLQPLGGSEWCPGTPQPHPTSVRRTPGAGPALWRPCLGKAGPQGCQWALGLTCGDPEGASFSDGGACLLTWDGDRSRLSFHFVHVGSQDPSRG